MNLLLALRSEKRSIVVVTHDEENGQPQLLQKGKKPQRTAGALHSHHVNLTVIPLHRAA